MITPYHNHDAGYISLTDIELANAPKTIQVEGLTLHRKSEFHISLVSLKRLVPLLETTEEELEKAFLEFQASHNLTTYRLTQNYRLVRRGEKATIIVMVEVDDIEALFDFLRQKYNRDIPTQPTHITLYTLQPEVGIGLFSDEEVTKESTPVVIPELANLKAVNIIIEQWLKAFTHAWEGHDIDAVLELFVNEVEYWETPFVQLDTKEHIRHEWQVIVTQENIKVDTSVFAQEDSTYVVRWELQYSTSDETLNKWAGVYLIRLNDEGLCTFFFQTGEKSTF